jgi:hypothetical protein
MAGRERILSIKKQDAKTSECTRMECNGKETSPGPDSKESGERSFAPACTKEKRQKTV